MSWFWLIILIYIYIYLRLSGFVNVVLINVLYKHTVELTEMAAKYLQKTNRVLS